MTFHYFEITTKEGLRTLVWDASQEEAMKQFKRSNPDAEIVKCELELDIKEAVK